MQSTVVRWYEWTSLTDKLDERPANARVGAERNPLKTEVIHCVNDLDAAQGRIRDVQNMAHVTTVTECKHFANILPGHPCSSWMFSSSRSKGDTGLRRTDSFAKSPGKAIASQKQIAANERDPTVGDFDGCRDSNEQLVRGDVVVVWCCCVSLGVAMVVVARSTVKRRDCPQ